ncbi:uncharacterized protein LOC112494496 isoform X4 [Cephus cinctus]|uniref:Uncharacterized protein LOC112494496 isoform X4 n=1 Tax=Cephus cinctus TaxID=211228 RepID=A0AAJ7RIU0_CEPCN|nr:uncharacterized protein LOC112494496 isoform X4 [Cephus cinctus]
MIIFLKKMVWKQLPIGTVIDSFKTLLTFEFLPKFKRNTTCFICNCLDRFLCACKPISTKRLQRKGVKSRGCGRKHCGTNCVCSCNRCKKYSSFQKKRVLNTNFLADLAYNHRVSRNQEIVGSQLDNEGKLNKDSNRISIQDPSQDLIKDHRDVYFIIYFSYILIVWIACLVVKFIIEFKWPLPLSIYHSIKVSIKLPCEP